MKAAVVETFDRPPQYRDFPEPAAGPDEVIVTVKAAARSQLVKAQAAGKHYSSITPPLIPGVDGVGCLADGQRVYFAFPRPPVGAMAERVAVKSANTIPLPDDIDDITAAAMANPGMSSWAALRERTQLQPGESVLINGATGASGRLAIQVARHLGAGRIVVTGRNPNIEAELLALGADTFIPLSQSPEALSARLHEEIAGGINIVLDYLWGPTAEAILIAATGHGKAEAAPRIRFINIGSLAGPTLSLPSAALRSSGLELLGTGLGSVSHQGLIRCIAGLLHAAPTAGFRIATESIPLTQVESAWPKDSAARMVFTL